MFTDEQLPVSPVFGSRADDPDDYDEDEEDDEEEDGDEDEEDDEDGDGEKWYLRGPRARVFTQTPHMA